MLTSALYLSAFWFILSFIPLILFGKNIRVANIFVTFLWFVFVIFLGSFLFPGMTLFEIVVVFLGIIWIIFLPNWNFLAKVAWIYMFFVTGLYLIYSFSITAFATANVIGFTLALLFFFVEVSALFLSLSYAFEALDTMCRIRWMRKVTHLTPLTYEPKVSLHLPSYNEPAEVVIKTLESVARLNYQNYEVLLIDNNTPNVSTWKALEVACQR